MNVVIGSSREQKLPSLVLEYTIKKHSSVPVTVLHTYDVVPPKPKNPALVSRTGFSFNRFMIPAMVSYQGIGAYLECDQIVFGDVKDLFSIPFDGATVLRPANQASVLLLDCSRLTWDAAKIVADLDAGKYGYKDLMENLCIEPAENVRKTLPEHWNSLERYLAGKTALLHYTNMDGQPWRKWGHALGRLWMDELKDALRSGAISMATVEEEVARKHIVKQVLEGVK